MSQTKVSFLEVSETRGVLPSEVDFGFSAGISAFDYDEDGDIDLYLPQRFAFPDRLYANDGQGNFHDIANTSGLDILAAGRSALWFDHDDDHRVDLLIVSDCFNSSNPDCASAANIRLYRQLDDLQFQDVTREAGLASRSDEGLAGQRSGLCCGDVDRDGDLDLLVGTWGGELQLFMNHDGVFVEETAARGITNPNSPFPCHPLQTVMHDFNDDGWIDIFTAVDFDPNQLWMNLGDGFFVDVATAAGVDFAFNDMGVTVGDYDNDGDFDIYVTNIFEFGKHNLLLRNESAQETMHFQEVAGPAGVDDTGYGWGATFFDADNDMHLDLAVTNGFFNGLGYEDRSRVFLNVAGQKPETFTDVSKASGFHDNLFGSCLVSADLNRDGDLDLLQVCIPALYEGPFRILENQLNESGIESNWLVVRPRQADRNHWCIGAVVTAETGGVTMSRSIHAGTSMNGQEPAEAFFGLGTHGRVDEVTVYWPAGGCSIWRNVPANQVFDARDTDFNLDGAVSLLDVVEFIESFGNCTWDCQADLDHDGDVDTDDAALFVRQLTGEP